MSLPREQLLSLDNEGQSATGRAGQAFSCLWEENVQRRKPVNGLGPHGGWGVIARTTMISTGCLDGCERGPCRAKEPCPPWTPRPTACTVMTQQSAPGKQERQWWQEHRARALGTADAHLEMGREWVVVDSYGSAGSGVC